VFVHPANVQDRDGAKAVLKRLLGRFPRLRLIWADGGYRGKLVEWAKRLGRYRRLSKDYEALPESSESMILIAMINLMSRRLSKNG